MSELLPTKKPAPAPQPQHRPAEGPVRRPAAPLADTLDAQLAARAPGPQPRDTGASALAGAALFRCGDPRFDGKPAAVVGAELDALVVRYEDGIESAMANADETLEFIRDREDSGVLQQITDAVTSARPMSVAPWLTIRGTLLRAQGFIEAARRSSPSPSGLVAKARLLELALRTYSHAQKVQESEARSLDDSIKGAGQTALSIGDAAGVVRDLSTAALIAMGATYFAPVLGLGGGAGAGASLAAPSTVGGTAATLGRLATLGGTLGGGVAGVGTALGGGSLAETGAAVGQGMRDGAIDSTSGAMGGAVTNGLWAPLRVAASAQGGPVAAVARTAAGAAGGAAGGLVGSTAKSTLNGASAADTERDAAKSTTQGALEGAIGGVLLPR